jgi:hypothetical protein
MYHKLFLFLTGFLYLLTSGCVQSNRSRHFIIGSSISNKVSIKEAVMLYLDARCTGNSEIICLFLEKETIDYGLQHSVLKMNIETKEIACRLKVEEIFMEKKSSNKGETIIFVHLFDSGNLENKYYMSFITKKGRIYIKNHLCSGMESMQLPVEYYTPEYLDKIRRIIENGHDKNDGR